MTIGSPVRIRVNNVMMAIFKGAINEDNLRNLYGLIREKAPKDSLTRDIGDLFAHPEKDRGVVKNLIKKRAGDFFASTGTPLLLPPLKSYIEIIDNLNECLKPYQQSLPKHLFQPFCLVLFNALQGAHILLGDKIAHLGFGTIFGDGICLVALLKRDNENLYFPLKIFGMPNNFNFPEVSTLSPDNEHNALLVIEFEGGKLKYWQETPHMFPNRAEDPIGPTVYSYPGIPLQTIIRPDRNS